MVAGRLFTRDNDLEAAEMAALFATLVSLWLGSPTSSSDLEAVDDVSLITLSCFIEATLKKLSIETLFFINQEWEITQKLVVELTPLA